jgi:hypothetical protein
MTQNLHQIVPLSKQNKVKLSVDSPIALESYEGWDKGA